MMSEAKPHGEGASSEKALRWIGDLDNPFYDDAVSYTHLTLPTKA